MRRSRSVIGIVGIASISLILGACGGSGSNNDSGDANKLEIASWWQGDVEGKALDAFLTAFESSYPDIEVINVGAAGGGGSDAVQKVTSDMNAGNAPDTIQWHAGAELKGMIDADLIEDLSDLYDEFKLREAFPEMLIERLETDGKIYSIPTNIHRNNMVWANPQVLKEAGIDPNVPAANIDAWIADMEKIKAIGKIPIAVGEAWTQTGLLETVLIAELGPDKYTGLWDGTTDWASSEVTKALEKFGKIIDFSNEDKTGMAWEEAADMVLKGDAAYHVMGDWAFMTFDLQDKKAPEDYIYFPVPGTAGVFDFLADSFATPKLAKNKDAAKKWGEVVSSKEAQIDFNMVKGSIPARSDLSEEELNKFPEYQQSAIKSFKDDVIVSSVAHGAAAPLEIKEPINNAVAEFTTGNTDIAGFQAALVEATMPLHE